MEDQREELYAAGKWPAKAKAEPAWTNIETAEVEFLNNLAEKGGLADPVPGMLRHCARLLGVKPRPEGMVYPEKPRPRHWGYIPDGSGVEWAAYDTAQMEAYARAAYADGYQKACEDFANEV